MACITVSRKKVGYCKHFDYFEDLFITESMSNDDKYIVIINHYKKHISCDLVLDDTECIIRSMPTQYFNQNK